MQQKSVEDFNNLNNRKTKNAGCTREIKSRIVTADAEFKKKKILFKRKLDLKRK
jgi:hypothetical protein